MKGDKIMSNYKLRHLPINMYDFNADRHRFSFEINGKRGEAWCTGKCSIYFTVGLTESDKCNISEEIWKRIDKDEMNWIYPKEAYDIADAYCSI